MTIQYKEFSPTCFDNHIDIECEPSEELKLLYMQKEIYEEIHGLPCPKIDNLIAIRESAEDRNNWLLAPVSRNRDSGTVDESNFKACLEILGGESETVEVHRFGHWGNGWFEIILVHPSREKEVKSIEKSLEDCPVLDEHDLSNREHEEMLESWENYGASDFEKELISRIEHLATKDDVRSDIEKQMDRERELDEFMPGGGMTYRMAEAEPPTEQERLFDRIEEIESWSSEQLRSFAFDWCNLEWESLGDGTRFKIDIAVDLAMKKELFWDDPAVEKEKINDG